MKTTKFKFILPLIVTVSFGFNVVKAQDKIDYSNPALINGSSFGIMFNAFYKLGDFKSMLQFTSSISRDKFKDRKILDHYMKMEFGYNLKKLQSIKKEGENFVMSYKTKINATDCIVRMRVKIENDSVKIILPANFLHQQIFLYK